MFPRGNPGREEDRATSPTIGAILFVAVAVVTATTVGGHVLQLVGTAQQPSAVATVEFQPGDERVTVTWKANVNAERVVVAMYVDDHHRVVTLNHVGQSLTIDPGGVTVRKGSVHTWDDPAIADGSEVTVRVLAESDGNSAVVAERTEEL